MQLIDGERDDSSLPKCCANVSALRDTFIAIARNGGEVDFLNQEFLNQRMRWVFPEHGVADGVLAKVVCQLGIKLAPEHEPQGVEL